MSGRPRDNLRKGRIHLARVTSDPDFWELRVQERRGIEAIRVRLTDEQFSGLMSTHIVTDVELEGTLGGPEK